MAFLVWTPWAIPGLLVLLVAGGMALFVVAARPDRDQNRRLGLQLGMEALVVSALAGGAWVIDEPVVVWALAATAYFFVWVKLWTYYSFLATLPTPLAKGLRAPFVLPALLLATIGAGWTVFTNPSLYIGAPVPGGPLAPWIVPAGTGFSVIMNMWGAMWVVGLTFSISALRHAPTAIQRRQSKAYLLAFGFRDISFALVVLGLTFVPPTSPWFIWVFLAFPSIWIVYPILVGYAILKTQLFDIDIHIKRTIKGSTIAAAFIAAFFVVSETAQTVFSERMGPILGIVAAGLLVFALAPLQRFADRVADGTMPSVEPTADYVAYRKLEVYRAAVEEALAEGEVSKKERRILDGLRTSLGVSPESAAALEDDVRRQLAAGPRAPRASPA